LANYSNRVTWEERQQSIERVIENISLKQLFNTSRPPADAIVRTALLKTLKNSSMAEGKTWKGGFRAVSREQVAKWAGFGNMKSLNQFYSSEFFTPWWDELIALAKPNEYGVRIVDVLEAMKSLPELAPLWQNRPIDFNAWMH